MSEGKRVKASNRVIVSNLVPRYRIQSRKVGRIAQMALKTLGCRGTLLSLVFVTPSTIKRLNQRFLNHSWATDVIAFPFSAPFMAKTALKGNRFLGEVMISPDAAKKNAKRFGTRFEEELSRYVCHGILHLKGYSDKTNRLKMRMRRKEDKILKVFSAELKGIIQDGH